MNSFEETIQGLSHHHPYDTEFQQAVKEVFTDIEETYLENKKYQEAEVLKVLTEPDRTLRFRVTWSDDNGKIHINRGWRVQFNNSLGPYKGGLRFHPTVNESVLKFLGFEQCFKNSLTGMPMGGAKGGSDFNPKGKSDREIRNFCHSFMTELYRYIGPTTDIPAGDIGVGEREIGFLFGQYLKITNDFVGVITGKSPKFGGSCGREEATGYGVIYLLKEILNNINDELKGKKVTISGAGNVALFAAQKAIEMEMKVLSLSNSDGTMYCESGLSMEKLQDLKKSQKQENMRLGEWCEKNNLAFKKNKKPWEIESDVVIPCATQNEIELSDAKEILKYQPLVLIEGANMPLTADALESIESSGTIYCPGKAANAGGVAVSGLERSQNSMHLNWSLKEVDNRLKEVMKDIHKHCLENIKVEGKSIPYKKGANIYSFKKIADTIVAYGLK